MLNKIQILTDKKIKLVSKELYDIHTSYLDPWFMNYFYNNHLKKYDESILYSKYDNSKLKVFLKFEDYVPLTLTDLFNEKNVEDLFKELKELHTLKVSPNFLMTWNYVDCFEIFNEKLSTQEYNQYYSLFLFLDSQQHNLVLSHNDLHIGNLMFNIDKIKVIDWDFVMLNSVYFDLASFISENDLENNLESLCDKYFAIHDQKYSLELVKYHCRAQDVIWTMWAHYLWKQTQNNDYLKIYQHKLEKIKKS